MRTLASILSAALLLCACASGNAPVQRHSSLQPESVPSDAVFAFRVGDNDAVTFRGAIDQSAPGSTTGWAMLYPAPDVISFFAAVGTHAALASQHQSKQISRRQEAANAVLTPYRSVVDGIRHRDLLQAALTKKSFRYAVRVVEPDVADASDWIVHTAPVFAMTQDETAIILDTAIQVFGPADRKMPAYQNIVRVVSGLPDGSSPGTDWMANDGAALKTIVESQFLRSLDLAILDVTTNPVPAEGQKTVRYRLGTAERVERGQVLRENCGEVVLRTLRGWVMAVPRSGGSQGCPG